MELRYLILIIILIFLIKWILKKYKKYKLVYNQNGFDGIYYYFVNKNIKNTGLNNFIDKKKYLLGKKIEKISKNKIMYGPYLGTKIINSHGWSNVDYSAKYLGTYENHIQEKIISLNKEYKLKNFVDLGAAEGFHIISVLKKKIFENGFAYEISKESRKLLKKNAQINGVSKRIEIFGKAEFESLKNNLIGINLEKTLFLVDIEGSEFDIFDEKFCNYFSKSYFIIEDHNFNVSNKSKKNKFYRNLKKYFKIEIIKDISKNPFTIELLNSYTDDEKYLMVSEGRPESMQWLILYPN